MGYNHFPTPFYKRTHRDLHRRHLAPGQTLSTTGPHLLPASLISAPSSATSSSQPRGPPYQPPSTWRLFSIVTISL